MTWLVLSTCLRCNARTGLYCAEHRADNWWLTNWAPGGGKKKPAHRIGLTPDHERVISVPPETTSWAMVPGTYDTVMPEQTPAATVTRGEGSVTARPVYKYRRNNVPQLADCVNAPPRTMESVATHALTPGATLGRTR